MSSQRHQLHKLDLDVPMQDFRPPRGVAQITCEAVRLCLTLSQDLSRKRRRGEAFDDPGTCEQSPQHEILVDTFAKNEDYDGLLYRDEDCVLNDHEHLCLIEQEAELVDDHHEPTSVRRGVPGDNEPLFFAGHSRNWSTQPTEKRTAQDCLHTCACKPTVQHCCVRAVEATLQLAICGVPHLLNYGFSVARGCDISALFDVMPSIWSPNYLEAVANRAVFMPTIVHALNSVLMAPTCKARCSFSEPSPVQEMSDESHADLHDGSRTSARLWRHVQVASHQSTRRLTRWSVPAEDARGSAGDLEDLNADESWVDLLADSPHVADDCILADDYSEDDLLDENLDFCDADDCQYAGSVGEEGQCRHDLNEHLPLDFFDGTHRVCASNNAANDIRTPTPAEHLDRIEATATSTWHGGESKLVSPSSQSVVMPSHVHVRANNLISGETKRPALNFELRNFPLLLEQGGRGVSMGEQREFGNGGGDEAFMTEADVHSSAYNECEMLRI